ncbi:MAG: hypothetical protein NW224_22505 [Leptolyngbyaceae cyanobacterium bins.302]|nr:hypothetical protein [Leptolyngbyaceae cyanobacterium bins.302]
MWLIAFNSDISCCPGGVFMFSIIRRIKDIKTLILTQLDNLREESHTSLSNQSSILENEFSLLEASTHLIEMLEAQNQAHQKTHAELLQQIQRLQRQQQQYRDALLSMTLGIQPQLVLPHQDLQHPDMALIIYLYSYLPIRRAIDIGASTGDASAQLLQTGYEVYAFEPSSLEFEHLRNRFSDQPAFHLFQVAIDASNSFIESPQIHQASLSNLHEHGKIPAEVGLVRINTPTLDLDVIQGMGSFKYPVVVTKFWDKQNPHPTSDTSTPSTSPPGMEQLVQEMRQREYYWYIVICRNLETREVLFYCNNPRTLDRSWGNVFFFGNYDLFAQALKWCSAMLQPAYFAS